MGAFCGVCYMYGGNLFNCWRLFSPLQSLLFFLLLSWLNLLAISSEKQRFFFVLLICFSFKVPGILLYWKLNYLNFTHYGFIFLGVVSFLIEDIFFNDSALYLSDAFRNSFFILKFSLNFWFYFGTNLSPFILRCFKLILLSYLWKRP